MPRIHHVTVTVPAEELIDVTAGFYALLGGERLKRPEMLAADTPGCWLGFDSTQVHLIVGESRPGKAHFALDMGEDYEPARQRLSAAGVEIREARRSWGARRCFVRDPAHNLVELFESPPESAPLG